ncbi:amino acid adenylation domain-containing protein [Micromonospora luteifusca]|uniref:non-ribosomal peptide synthetase n=1 Tax=Micromonospora luteifusca TaxID=709860 RepID=UPI0033A7D0A1
MGESDTVASLLSELAPLGVKLKLSGDDRLEVSAPRGRLSGDLRDRIVRHKPELIEWLRRALAGGTDAELPTLVPDEEHLYEPFPPSDLQQSFLIGSREGFEFHVRPHQYMEFDFDELEPVRFEEALNRAVHRQRKNLVVVRDDMLLQTVRDPAPVTVTVSDLRGLPEDEAQLRIEQVRAGLERKEPAHDRWPWLEPHISRYGDGRARLHYNNNNIFTDAPSGVALITDALRYYHQPELELPEPAVSYRDCVLALAELEESPLGQASKKYWCDRMADWPAAPELPLVSGTEHRGRSMLSRRELTLEPRLWATLKRQAEAYGVTPTNALLGAHAEVIAYWSGSRHFLLNNMISHRPLPLHPEMAQVLGNFASLYPLEVDWRPDEPFHARARRLQATVMADVAHAHWSGSKVLQTLNQVRRTPGRAICPFAVGSALFVGPADRAHYSVLETPQTLLDTEFWELRDGSLLVIWDVIEAMFPDGLIDAMLAGYRTVVGRLAEDDAAWRLDAFDLLPETQRRQRDQLNRSVAPMPTGLLHDPLPGLAAARPAKPAVVSSAGRLSYGELHRRSAALGDLLRERGTTPGDRVAVVLPKGPEQMVAVLAALGADAAYVPIDPHWPADRIRLLLADTGASAVLTDPPRRAELMTLTEVPVLTVDAEGPTSERPAAGRADASRRSPEDLAYVIYTSGSTGRPKGAMLDHRGPLNTILDINRRFDIGPDDVVFGVSSLCFDLSVYDVFGTIAAGATMVTPTPAQADPVSWVELVRSHRVTVWNSVPALMQLFVEEAITAGAEFPALRVVLLSGDWIPVQLPERIRRVAPNARVISLGGATEASIWSICFPIEAQDPRWPSIPYGRPLANQTWCVLDASGRDVPTWVPGELFIGGAGVAQGYLGDPDRTGLAFVPHPRTGERLYRTGDLGRYLPSGDIEFLGRADFQVKIQGFRVEPGEIEHALLDHPDVSGASVVARQSGSGRQLAAFVVVGEGRDRLEPPTLRAFLSDRLPSYLIPSHFVVVDRLPLTGNGKVDRRALEQLWSAGDDGERGHTEPATPTERALAGIWESVLQVDVVGVHDDFFDLGGQSFAALRVSSLIVERLGRRVPLGALLERRTIAALAEWLDASEQSWSPLVRLTDRGDGPPWYLVHPAGGNVVCYRSLAAQLGQPTYGFQAPGPDSGQQPLEKIEDLANLYVRALVGVQPHGPYLLGGWSSGAIVAAEMARQLEQRGERVAELLVIDAPAPVAPREIPETELLLWFLEDLDVGFDPGRVAPEALRELAAVAGPDRLTRALELLAAQGLGPGALDPAELAATLAVFQGVVRACNSYQGARITADITVIRAQRDVVSEFAGHPTAGAADWGWSALTSGNVTHTVLPGTHHTLLTNPQTIAAVSDVIGVRTTRARVGRPISAA